MEGQKQEDWWFGEFPNYSLTRYKDMPIYQRFISSVRPFSKIMGEYREAFWRDENCFIFEWFDSTDQKGEKFGLDHNSTTYFYEHWFTEDDVHIVEKSWLCDPSEWGVVIKYYPEYSEEVTWTMEQEKKIVETRIRKDDKVQLKSQGQKLTPEGLEDFTELFWETPTGYGKEKTWTRGEAKGEEKEYKDGDKKWGESWVESDDQVSKKTWNEEGSHKWGEGTGEEGYEKWKEKWDKNSEGSFEEIEIEDRFKNRGKVRVRSLSNEYKVEWEGVKPVVSVPDKEEESVPDRDQEKKQVLKKPKSQKLRSGKRPENAEKKPQVRFEEPESQVEPSGEALLKSDAGQVSNNEKLAFQLSSLFKDLKKDLATRISELKPASSKPAELNSLFEEARRMKDPNPFDPQDALAGIQALRDLDKRLLAAEKSLVSGQPTSEQLKALFDQSANNLLALAPALDPSNLSEVPSEVQRLSKEFDQSPNNKEKIQNISALGPKIQELLRASQEEVEDHHKELADISFKLSPVLRYLEEAVKESQETLAKIQQSFAKDFETFDPFIKGFNSRAKELQQALECSKPYTETIPQAASLLIDLEKLKRELLTTDFDQKLKTLDDQVKEINSELANHLNASLKDSVVPSQNLQDLLGSLLNGVDKTQALVDKALGKNSETGNPELDGIAPKVSEDIKVDPLEILNKVWSDGKSALDHVNKALTALGDAVGSAEDKQRVSELIDQNSLAVTGMTPQSKTEAFEQLSATLDEFLPCLHSSSDLLQNLTEKIKSSEPSDNKDLWRALTISEKITEKIVQDRSESEEFKSPVELLPENPTQEDLTKALLKSQELNLSLLNNDSELTSKELSEIDSQTKRKPSKKTLAKKPKKALRSGRGELKKVSFVEPMTEMLEASLKTASELALWVLGSRPNVLRQLESLKTEKQEVLELLTNSYGTEETTEKFLAYLKKLEDAKQGTYTGAEISKNLAIIIQKCEKVLETTEKIVGTPVPEEVAELQKRKMTENLPEYSKRIGFFLSIFFKMVKDATGVDEGGENLEEALSQIKKKQAVTMLPFDGEQLLGFLHNKSQKEISRLKFLAGLVGTDEDIEDAGALEDQAEHALPDLSHGDGHESLAQIDYFLNHYPEIGTQIEGKTGEFLQKLVEKLVNPEPLEKDVGNLIETIEKQAKALEKLGEGENSAELSDLEKRKEVLPTSPKDLVPYLSELSKDYSTAVLAKLGENGPTDEEQAKLRAAIQKKLKVAPLQVTREIQHLFSGPNTDDMVSMILKLNKVTGFFLNSFTVGDPALYSMCTKDFARLSSLTPMEVKALGKDYADVLLSFIDTSSMEDISNEEAEMKKSRSSIKRIPTVTWETIFHNKGLDLDSGLLCDVIDEEQELASVYLIAIPKYLGSGEQKRTGLSLVEHSKEIRRELDVKSKIEEYFLLRLEESKLVAGLCMKLQSVFERICELDKERETGLARGLAEVSMLVERNNPLLKEQVEMLIEKEKEYKDKELTSAPEYLMRLANYLSLEKELQRIKDEAKPKSNESEELIKSLSSIETSLHTELKALNQFLQTFSADLLPGKKSLKHLTEQELSTTVPALLASLNTGLKSHNTILQAVVATTESSPVHSTLASLAKLLQIELQKDDADTEAVFSGLFRLCGSAEDKANSKKLRETRTVALEDKPTLYELCLSLHESLAKAFPARSAQSRLQNKLIKEVSKLRDNVDDVDASTEELLNRALREVANSILPEDSNSKGILDKIKKNVEALNEKSPTNIPDYLERIASRLEEADKIEKLRRELREKNAKEINRLKGDVQDKLNEIATVTANMEAQKTGFDAQIALLQNSANLNASLVDKLTSEAVEKERSLSNAKNAITELKAKNEDLEEELERCKADIDSINQEIRNLRKVNKEKDSQIRDLSSSVDAHERSSDKISLGDKEKSEVMDKLKADNRTLRSEAEDSMKKLEDLKDLLQDRERSLKKIEIEKTAIDAELEKLRNERSQLKVDLMKTKNEKLEYEEKLKMTEGSEEIKQLERILEDKQKELEEAEAKLAVAKRYQILYPELTVEKQEIETKLREVQIDLDEIRRKYEDIKRENDQIKFKLATSESLSKAAEELQRENQKLKIRVNFLERGSSEKDSTALNKQLAEEIAAKDSQIKDLLDEIERLKKLLQSQIEKYQSSLCRNFLVRLCQTYKEMERQGFTKWRSFKVQAGIKLDLVPKQMLLEESKDSNPEIVQALSKTAEDLFASNKLIVLFKEVSDLNEKPMSFKNVFKFLEELLDRKFEADKQDERDSKPLMSLPEFMIEFLMKTFGIRSLALKFLSQFIPGFYEVYKDRHKYAAVFARLLQIFHPEPAPLVLAVFVVKARMEFNHLVEKHDRALESEGKKESEKEAYEAAGNGGRALVGDVIELVYALFQGDSAGGEKVLELIRPEKVSIEDYVAFKICHKMAKLGKTPEMIFNMLDKDQGGTIDSSEFIAGTKIDLDLWISDQNVERLVKALDVNGNREITKESFMSVINMRFLLDSNKSLVWTVTKSSFMTALLDVFSNKQKVVFRALQEKVKSTGVFTKEIFMNSVNELETSVTAETAEKMFDEAKDRDKVVKLQAAGEVASKYALGELKCFKSRELMQQLQRRKLVNITEDESISVSTRSKKSSFVEGNIRIDRDEEEKTIIRKKVIKKLVKRIVG